MLWDCLLNGECTYTIHTLKTAKIIIICQIHTADADATQLSSWVASAVWTEFATSSRRPLTDSIDNLEIDIASRLHSGLTTWILINIDNFFNNDVIMSPLDTNLNSCTAQEIVNLVTTAAGCVHAADTTQLDSWVASASAVCIGLSKLCYLEHFNQTSVYR